MKRILQLVIIFMKISTIVFGQKYKLIYKSKEFCENPDPPYEERKKVDVNLTVVNDSDNAYFQGNFSVKENLSGYYWRFKNGYEKSGNIVYENDFKGLSCRTFIPRLICGMTKINLDPKTCEIRKGNYSFTKLELNKLDRATNYYPMRRLGTNIFYLSYYKASGTCFCIQVRVLLKKV